MEFPVASNCVPHARLDTDALPLLYFESELMKTVCRGGTAEDVFVVTSGADLTLPGIFGKAAKIGSKVETEALPLLYLESGRMRTVRRDGAAEDMFVVAGRVAKIGSKVRSTRGCAKASAATARRRNVSEKTERMAKLTKVLKVVKQE